jgi:hypothetical protein
VAKPLNLLKILVGKQLFLFHMVYPIYLIKQLVMYEEHSLMDYLICLIFLLQYL